MTVSLEKKDSSEDIFHIRFSHSYRNPKNQREKSVSVDEKEDVSVNLSENICTHCNRKMTQKSCIYLPGMSNQIFQFVFKTSQYPFATSIC